VLGVDNPATSAAAGTPGHQNTNLVFAEVEDIIPDTVVSTTNPDACPEYKGRGYVARTVYNPMCDIVR